MDAADELSLPPNAVRTLEARYLRRDRSGRIVETPRELFERVARVVAAAERAHGADADAEAELRGRFFSLLARGVFFPNSPTLMNAGSPLGVLSACFVLPIADSVAGIFESVKHAALIQKAGGGTGFSFDRLRPTGDYIASSGGRSSGPMSFWRVFCEATRAIQQGAFRRGANMAMMSAEHPDILKFVAAKNDPAAFENFNISVKVTDAFMDALRRQPDAPHVVVNPNTGERHCLPAGLDVARYGVRDLVPAEPLPARGVYTRRMLWDVIVQSAWATGEPGLCFIDRVNADNPTPALGRIEATNPCGEQPLLDYEACNLGSIDLSKHLAGGRLDERALRGTIRLAVRFLDDVIDANSYIVERTREICLGNRKIGLGLMGLADALFALGIRYDSDEALAFARRAAELLAEEATAASEELAASRGVFPNYPGSTWQTQRGRRVRNAAVTCIAPTGTLSILAGCTGGIEPAFALVFERRVLGGQRMLEVNRVFREYAERRGFWSEGLAARLARGERLAEQDGVDREAAELFVTAHDVSPEWHVRMQAAMQRSIDGAISKTINLPGGAGREEVDRVYRLAYDLGCKGVTVYRDGCRAGQPMAHADGALACPQCRAPLAAESGCTRCARCGAALCAV